MSPEADTIMKLVLGIVGAGSGIITWFARNSFEDMKHALETLTATVNELKTNVALRTQDIDELKRRVSQLETDVRQIREG